MIAIQKPPTIGPTISCHTRVLRAGDLSRLGSGEKNLSRPSGTKAVGRASERVRVNAGVRASCFSAKPLTENYNVVPSLSLGLAAQRPTPGKLPHKIQPLMAKPREARIRTAANSPKIQHCFSHPQTNPHPKSTLAHPKSTVDLRCEGLIRVENGLRSPLLPTGYRPISGPKIKESNQNQTAANQKIYSSFQLIPASRSKCFPPFPSTANEEFQVKTRPLFHHPYSNLFHPMPTYSTHFDPPRFLPGTITRAYSTQFFVSKAFKAIQSYSKLFKAVQSYSKQFKAIQSSSKQFKAIQGFLKHFFIFMHLPRNSNQLQCSYRAEVSERRRPNASTTHYPSPWRRFGYRR